MDFLSKKLFDSTQMDQKRKTPVIHMPSPTNESLPVPFVKCPEGHLTHAFLACDVQSACWQHQYNDIDGVLWGVPSKMSCPAPLTPLPAMFACSNGAQHVAYSLVCDHQQQCDDGSDERFCIFSGCSDLTPFRCGTSQQCVRRSALCNGEVDCTDASDEHICVFSDFTSELRQKPPPSLVHFTPVSALNHEHPFTITPLPSPPLPNYDNHSVAVCPETHFQCLVDGYCLPVFVRCNAVLDCPGHEDEADCQTFSCTGLYRCRGFRICLHPSHVCDEVYQCPQKDDELFCRVACPDTCTCHGLAFRCPARFWAKQFPDVRFLDASGSGMTPWELGFNSMLVQLILKLCHLQHFHNISMPNLQILDLSFNDIQVLTVTDLKGVLNLQHLALSDNPLKAVLSPGLDNVSFPALLTLDLSHVLMDEINLQMFSVFPQIQSLNLSHCGIVTISGEAFHTNSLKVLDFTGCPMTQTPRSFLLGLEQLQSVYTDNFQLCCPVMLPENFDSAWCRAPHDGLSSCEALLRSDIFRVFLSLFSIFSLTGNFGCFLMRTICFKRGKSGFNVFVTHLSFSDFLMGVYLAMIGVADRMYLGSYLWEAESWRHGWACQAAGFLSLLSGEVSAVIICLITLDRFLVLTFPFKHLHFQHVSAHLACTLVWLIFIFLAAIPLLPVTSHWSLYSQTGICMPLPITSNNQAGHYYAFGILIVFNFILFLLIAMGQFFIYMSVRANSMKMGDSSQNTNEVQIARRLITVAVSDFLCWFPIGLLGLLASQGHPVSGQVNVSLAIFVLPLNSALNPFLYTLNVILQHRRRHRDEKLLKEMLAQINEQEIN